MTKVIRALFEEGLGPCRTTPLGTSFASPLERSAVMLWGVIRTHVATERMLAKDLRDHHIITGNYAKWLVNNSGKKDITNTALIGAIKPHQSCSGFITWVPSTCSSFVPNIFRFYNNFCSLLQQFSFLRDQSFTAFTTIFILSDQNFPSLTHKTFRSRTKFKSSTPSTHYAPRVYKNI